MDNEEKIQELTRRIEALESAEKKRKVKKRIKIAYETTKILIVIALFLGSYLYINAKIIKPYKQATETINAVVNEKVSNLESRIDEKIDVIKGWFKK